LSRKLDGDLGVGRAPAPDGNALVLLKNHVIGEDRRKAEWFGRQGAREEGGRDEKKCTKGEHVGGSLRGSGAVRVRTATGAAEALRWGDEWRIGEARNSLKRGHEIVLRSSRFFWSGFTFSRALFCGGCGVGLGGAFSSEHGADYFG
jgi:hypothetical protein